MQTNVTTSSQCQIVWKIIRLKNLHVIEQKQHIFKKLIWFSEQVIWRYSLTDWINQEKLVQMKNLTKCTCIDLKKSLDTVNDELLQKKCEHYELRGMVLKMLDSYLKDPLQYIKNSNLNL